MPVDSPACVVLLGEVEVLGERGLLATEPPQDRAVLAADLIYAVCKSRGEEIVAFTGLLYRIAVATVGQSRKQCLMGRCREWVLTTNSMPSEEALSSPEHCTRHCFRRD